MTRARTFGHVQSLRRAGRSGAANADHTSPLRMVTRPVSKFVGEDRIPIPHYLLLECGHVVREPGGWSGGWIPGSRRRCRSCADGKPPTPTEEFE